MSIKINKLEIENVKRIKAVKIEPAANGLTIVGGNNNQGKTSVLDSIAWALGGEKYRPSEAQRQGSVIPPNLHIVMSNGLIVERKGKNSSLKVTDPDGNKGGQQLLNDFVEQLALDLPKFMESSGKEKAETLLKIIGVGDKLTILEKEEQDLYNRRLTIGQIADQKKKFADEQTYYPDAPKELVSAADLIKQQQDVLAKNGENQRKREQVDKWNQSVAFLTQEVEAMKEQLQKKEQELADAQASLNVARMSAQDLQDKSTTELESSIANIEEINRKVRANMDKDKAEDDALDYKNQYASLTKEVEDTRKAKTDLLNAAELPLPELSVKDGELVYKGQKWDNMSGSDRLKVSTAIVRKLNPECGFVLLDKLEQMDINTLNEFGQWLEQEGLQAIATRVSTGGECSIIIDDGYVVGAEQEDVPEPKTTGWKAGEF
ncbi:AAA family ATPase [Clostridioides difficile]|jgi:DNA repair exonuclease SbcCD ATPase subunit|uniref:AAA family ATPase n=1 Tax=Muricomes intestini TaxID=1796634 RepID=UPI002960DA17|nr:AAA family ATPase [Clostridioides difficile]